MENKTIKITIVSVLIIVSIFFLYNTGLMNMVKTNIVNSVKVVKITEDRSNIEYDNLSIVVRMPKMHYENKTTERYINSYIRNSINNYVNHKRQETELDNNYKDTNILISYDLVFQNKDIINIVIIKEVRSSDNKFYATKESYVFDLNTGQRIYIDNILNENESYSDRIKEHIGENIDKNNINIDKGSITLDKDTNFMMVDGGISIILDKEEDGSIIEYEFKIPYEVLENEVSLVTTSKIIANIDTQTITQNNRYINSILNIPIIISSNKEIDKEINYRIREEIIDFYNKNYESAKVYFGEVGPIDNKFVANVNYDVKKNSNDILSIVLTYYQYSGGAHGYYENISYNIDMKNGKILNLNDLFKDKSNYILVINNEIKKQIENLPKGEKDVYQFKSIKKDNKFYIEDNNIVIYFDLYEIAPFAAGIPEFYIDDSVVKDILKIEHLKILK